MKRLFLAVILFSVLILAACGQTLDSYHQSPQDVAWDEPANAAGLMSYDVAVILEGDDQTIPANYRVVALNVPTLEINVDLDALSLFGDYIVCVRANRDVHGDIETTAWAQTDDPNDTSPVGTTWGLYNYGPLGNVLSIRIK